LQGTLQERHFGQDPATNQAVLGGVEMRPTEGFQIFMIRQGKALAHAINTKRHAVVKSLFFLLLLLLNLLF
jgi:hypothetical protein